MKPPSGVNTAPNVLADAAQNLTTNFRTVAPVLDWVNTVFGHLIQPQESAQPAYEALDRHRAEPVSGPAVTVLGADAHTDLPRGRRFDPA